MHALPTLFDATLLSVRDERVGAARLWSLTAAQAGIVRTIPDLCRDVIWLPREVPVVLDRTVVPLLYTIIYVPEVEGAVDFYERAFGLARSFVHESGDFAQLSTGATSLAFTSHALGATAVPVPYQPLDPGAAPVGFELTLLTPDVRAGFDRAVGAGAEPVAEPHETPWGQTVAYVRDHVGVLVGIATPMDAPPDPSGT